MVFVWSQVLYLHIWRLFFMCFSTEWKIKIQFSWGSWSSRAQCGWVLHCRVSLSVCVVLYLPCSAVLWLKSEVNVGGGTHLLQLLDCLDSVNERKTKSTVSIPNKVFPTNYHRDVLVCMWVSWFVWKHKCLCVQGPHKFRIHPTAIIQVKFLWDEATCYFGLDFTFRTQLS